MNQFLKSVIAASALVVATAASAAPVTVTFGQDPANGDFTDAPASGAFYLAGYSSGWTSVTAGEFEAKITGGASFAAYCYDMKVTLDDPGMYNVSSTQLLNDVERLFYVAGFDGSNWKNDGVTGIESAALQLAIWESKYDGLGAFDLGSGNVKFKNFSQGIIDTAATFAAQAKALPVGFSGTVQLFSSVTDKYGNPTTQALVTAVPEPSTYALMAACLGVVGFVARRKKSV